MDLVLLETVEEDNKDAAESEQDAEDESDEEDANADLAVVGTWIEALNAMRADPDKDDLNYDDQWYFDRMGEDDGPLDDNDYDSIDVEDEEPADHPPEKRKDPMEPLPDYNIPMYAQENGEYLSTKRYLRNDKMRLVRFMELANITSTNMGDQAIEFPELYEIYS
jgi:hypothetical protein